MVAPALQNRRSECIVAYPDRTAVFGDYFLLGGNSGATRKCLSLYEAQCVIRDLAPIQTHPIREAPFPLSSAFFSRRSRSPSPIEYQAILLPGRRSDPRKTP